MDADYPIDIQIHKLLDWLISRKICDSSWISEIKPVRDKIRHALGDMPEHAAIAQLLSGGYLHYFYAVRIVDILKQTEADTKNIFGMYGSNRMKDWAEILKLYQRRSLYLAESADILHKNIKYEIPNYKKHVSKLESSKGEARKRIEEYERAIVVASKEVSTLKKQLGIKGDSITAELKASVDTLPDRYDAIMKQISGLDSCVSYYVDYSAYVLSEPLELPLLSHLIHKGNTTTFEFKNNRVPSSVEEFVFTIESGGDSTEDVIDWGDGDGIDWDSTTPVEIVVESESVLTVEEESDVAKGSLALLILDNPDLRNPLLDQLHELLSFYKINIAENSNSDNTNLTIPKAEPYEASLEKLSAVIASLNDAALVYLQNIKHSPVYLEKLLANYQDKLDTLEKARLSIEVLREKIATTDGEVEAFLPKLATLIESTKELRGYLCEDISGRYNGRVVELIGKIE